MAQRVTEKSERRTGRSGAASRISASRVKAKSNDASSLAGGDAAGLLDRIALLEGERDQAVRQLGEARQRIAELESSCNQVVNRIDWVIDSLYNLPDRES